MKPLALIVYSYFQKEFCLHTFPNKRFGFWAKNVPFSQSRGSIKSWPSEFFWGWSKFYCLPTTWSSLSFKSTLSGSKWRKTCFYTLFYKLKSKNAGFDSEDGIFLGTCNPGKLLGIQKYIYVSILVNLASCFIVFKCYNWFRDLGVKVYVGT